MINDQSYDEQIKNKEGLEKKKRKILKKLGSA
jgi:hypothetical protein